MLPITEAIRMARGALYDQGQAMYVIRLISGRRDFDPQTKKQGWLLYFTDYSAEDPFAIVSDDKETIIYQRMFWYQPAT